MNKSGSQQSQSPSQLIDARIKELDDWRGSMLSRLRSLVKEADPEVLVNAPKWLSDERFDIMAKVSPESSGRPVTGNLPMDIYEIEEMLRALLIERFQITYPIETTPARNTP